MVQVTNPTSTKAIKMYLKVNNEELDLTDAGLLSASFDRFGDPNNENSDVLTRLDLVVFDVKGSQVLSRLTGGDAKTITFRYGFVDDQAENKYIDLSPEYTLDIIKLKTRWTNGGATVSVGAVGRQKNNVSSGARIYLRGESIKDIVLDIARAQGWNTSYVKIDESLQLSEAIYKDAKTEDWDFINQTIKPLCYSAGIVTGKNLNSWVVKLFTMGAETYLQFAPTGANIERRVWVYDVGTSSSSSVIEFTSELDLSFLINGLSIVLYDSDISSLIKKGNDVITEANTPEAEIQEILKKSVKKLIKDYNLPITLPDRLNFNVTLKFSENLGSLTVEQRILAAIDHAIQSVSKVTLKVIGNPQIKPADLVKLEVTYNDQTSNLISANGDRSFWKVIQITENIGLDGYTTDLVLTREILNTGGNL